MSQKCEDVKMPFGKHRGVRLGDILDEDPTYIDWLQTQDFIGDLGKAVAAMNLKYQDRIDQAVQLDRSERY